MAPASDGSVQSVQRALQILSLFSSPRPEWSVGDIARTLGLSKSVVSRLLATMAREGFVVQDAATKRYVIGPQAFAVGSAYKPFMVLETVLHPSMEQLAQQSGHAVSVGVPSGRVFTIIDTVQGTSSVRVAFEVGQRPYYHSAAIGKLLLATMPDDEVGAIVGPDPLRKVTPYTHESIEDLMADLQTVRRTGVAISRQESILGVGAVAAGIRNAGNECIAGISIVYPVHLVTDDEINHFAQLTLETADRISRRLGNLSLDRPGPVASRVHA